MLLTSSPLKRIFTELSLYTRYRVSELFKHKELTTFPCEDIAGSVWCPRMVLTGYTVTETIKGLLINLLAVFLQGMR